LREIGVPKEYVDKIENLISGGMSEAEAIKSVFKEILIGQVEASKSEGLLQLASKMEAAEKALWFEMAEGEDLEMFWDEDENETEAVKEKPESEIGNRSGKKIVVDSAVTLNGKVAASQGQEVADSNPKAVQQNENQQLDKLPEADLKDFKETGGAKAVHGDVDKGALEHLDEFLERIEESISDVLDNSEALLDYEFLNEYLQSGDMNFKTFLVKEINDKMIEVKSDFNKFKNDVASDLKKVVDDMEVDKKVTLDTKEVLGKVIDKLDKMLLKSDIPLYTTMKQEKKLLLMSSDLEEARSLIEAGKFKEGLKTVKNVMNSIEEMTFQPSMKKVVAMGRGMMSMEQNVVLSNTQNTSSRSVLETLRNLGVNNEAEIAEKAFGGKRASEDRITENAKTILMKMVEKEGQEHKTVTSAEKTLNNLVGQQLMNKLDAKQGTQKLQFNIPIQVMEKVKNLKVHVNSKKNHQKMDWKNNSMYFLIDLEKYGQTGIKIDVVDAHVKVTLRNDNYKEMETLSEDINKISERLAQVGFSVDHIEFEPLTENKTPAEAKSNQKQPAGKVSEKPKPKKEGFDFKI